MTVLHEHVHLTEAKTAQEAVEVAVRRLARRFPQATRDRVTAAYENPRKPGFKIVVSI